MTALRNVSALVQKEWRHCFGSPIAYVALFVWALLFGILFYFAFTFFLQESMMASQQMQYGGGPKLSMNEYQIRPVLGNMPWWLLRGADADDAPVRRGEAPGYDRAARHLPDHGPADRARQVPGKSSRYSTGPRIS